MANSRLFKLLEVEIKSAADRAADSIIGGLAPDYASYRDYVGYIRGLNDALTLCNQIEEDMNK